MTVMRRLRSVLGRPSLVLFACMFASQAGLLVLSPILPELAHDFGVSTATAGQLRTLSGATGGITAVVLALAPRRPALRTLLSLGATLVAAGSVLSAAAPSFATLAVAQGVIGIGIGVLIAVAITASAEWTAPAERARTLAWAIAGMPAAWVTGMPVAGAVAAVGWRLSWLALPATTAVVALVLVRLAPPDRGAAAGRRGPAAWRRPDVARFTAAELLANAAWAGVLTYAGSLLIEGYGAPRTLVAAGLATTAAAMLPGTFVGRRRAAGAGIAALATLTLAQAVAVAALGAARPSTGVSLGLLAVMAFLNGWRSVVASAMGMDSAPDDRLTVMAMRAAANQFGYLLGAAAGGLALAAGGFPAVGATFAALFVAGALLHLAPRLVVEPRAVEAPA